MSPVSFLADLGVLYYCISIGIFFYLLVQQLRKYVMYKHSSSSSATTTTRSGVESQTTLFNLFDVRLEIGTLVRQNKDQFFVAWEGPPTGLHFTIDPGNQKCIFCFSQSTSTPVSSSSSNNQRKRARMGSNYKAEFLVLDITEFKHYKTMSLEILLRLASPPFIWKRGGTRNEFWNRTIDFSATGAIGRSDIYKLTIPPEYSIEWNKFINYLKQLRVNELDIILPIVIQREPSFGSPRSDPFYSIHPQKYAFSFEVLFLVNAVLHKGIFNQHQFDEVFFDLLRCQPKYVNVAALNYLYLCSGGRPVVDACKRLRDVQEMFLANPNASEDNKINKLDEVAYVRKLIITPTKAYCIPPEPEMPNRVLRQYKHESDRFLRVMFMDEGMKTVFYNVLKLSPKKETEVYSRFKSMLSDGFELCGRKYSFLAFSSNQLRDRSAWFFAECENIKIRDIHTWMGKFTHRNVAKCSARMGQCFSSTRATVGVPSTKVKMISDIERNGYNFSDGIGKIAPDLAMEVAKRLNLESDPPSAYQIRYAGFKGVIACWPSEEGNDTCSQLYLRDSMKKFESDHTRLEICTWTRFQPGYLNRQIITLLSTLGVSDEVFWTMQQQMVTDLNRMLEDADAAFEVITASCTEQGKTAAQMLSAGFKPQTEPHLRSMLSCIRASQLTGLREKSRIFVPSGRWLMGCLDELGVLEQGQCFVQVSEPLSLEKCGGGANQRQQKRPRRVVKGLVVVAKNPCLHPGDVRILEAVDAPGIHHLLDCLVFPQKGDRPHCNEASGSDLDGDTYFVTWDEHLMPPSKQSIKPMEFDNSKAKLLDRPVTNNDIVEFFVENMANESLGAICNAHVVHADLCEDGASNPKCLQLAELAARAVDLPKTGEVVTMPQGLKPKSYPDFMGKEEFMSYKSTKILGKLYRQITDDSMPLTCDSTGSYYDMDLEIPGAEKFIDDAWELKCSYNLRLKSLMRKYSVTREVEVVTGHIWSMPKRISNKRGELQEQLKQSYNALRKQFRKRFERIRMKGRTNFKALSDEMKSSLYEQKASAWYIVTYRPDMVKKSMNLKQGPDDDEDAGGPHQEDVTLLRSFPWIVTDYLGRIKMRRSTR